MEAIVIGFALVFVAGMAFGIWRYWLPITRVDQLAKRKEGASVKVIGRIGNQTQRLTDTIAAHAIQQFRGKSLSDWRHVRQRRLPLEIELEGGTVRVENIDYLIRAKEQSFFALSGIVKTHINNPGIGRQESRPATDSSLAYWEESSGRGTMRRAALRIGDTVTVYAKVASSPSGLTLVASEVQSRSYWEWLSGVDEVPVASVAELRALPVGTAVQFYARPAASHPKEVDSFVLVDEEEYCGGSAADPKWRFISSRGQIQLVDLADGSVRVQQSKQFQLRMTTLSQGEINSTLYGRESEAGVDYQLTSDHNGQVETAEYDAKTGRGTRRFRGIEVGDYISIIGNVEHDASGVTVKATAVWGYRQAFGLLTTKPGTPSEADKLPDLM